MAFFGGLRRGELQALRWHDVDLAAGVIRVERGWDQAQGAIKPKSRAGYRVVPLLGVLRDVLTERRMDAATAEPDDLVFGHGTEKAFAPTTEDQRAKRAWKAVGLPSVTMHEARHCYASILIDAGENPKAIQTYLGHEKITTTFDTYGHLLPGSHDEPRSRMDVYLAERERVGGALGGAAPETP